MEDKKRYKRETELQIYFHDAVNHPLQIFSNSSAGKFKIKVAAAYKVGITLPPNIIRKKLILKTALVY